MRPEIKKSLDRYAKERVPTGGFLRKVLENDLFGAIGKADTGNRNDLFSICSYIYNELPMSCWGSPKHVKEWLEGDKHEK